MKHWAWPRMWTSGEPTGCSLSGNGARVRGICKSARSLRIDFPLRLGNNDPLTKTHDATLQSRSRVVFEGNH